LPGSVLTVSILFHIIHATFYMDFLVDWRTRRPGMMEAFRRFWEPAAPARKYPSTAENKLYHGVVMLTGLAVIAPAYV